MEELINSVGALCEMAKLLRDNLISNGFSYDESFGIVKEFLLSILTQHKRSTEEE